MVRLNRIYTRTGDDGTTELGDGTRLPKSHPRIASYGTVDELSSFIGLALAHGVPEPWGERLRSIQNDLFDVGSDLCVPVQEGEGKDGAPTRLRVDESYTRRIEGWIDEVNEALEPLNSFVLPGGQPAAAWMHVARTVCRRAEREIVMVLDMEDEAAERFNSEVARYLNRLSDLLFCLSRAFNGGGEDDVLWVPGGTRE